MDKLYDKLFEICPEKYKSALEEIDKNLPSERNSICIAFSSEHVKESAIGVSEALNSFGDIYLLQLDAQGEIGHSYRFVLILDSLDPINEKIVSFLSHISSYKSLINNLAVYLINTDKVPSVTAIKRNIRIVLEQKGITPKIVENEEDLKTFVGSMTTDDETLINGDAERKECDLVTDALQEELRAAYIQKENYQKQLKSFGRKKESLEVYSKQLLLDMWLMIQKSCDENLESDVKTFASEMLKELNETIKATEIKQMQYYFASYINYLWGEFLSQEIEMLLDSVKQGLQSEIEKLLDTYKDFFNEHASICELNPISIYSGSQPVSFDVDHFDYTFNRIFDAIVGNIVRFYLLSKGDWLTGGKMGKIVTGIINRFIQPLLRRKCSDEEIKRMYSEAVYSQFYDNINSMVTQLRDYLVPALERNFTESLQEIIIQFEDNIEMVGNKIYQNIHLSEVFIKEIQEKIDFVNNLKN